MSGPLTKLEIYKTIQCRAARFVSNNFNRTAGVTAMLKASSQAPQS